MTDKQTLTLLLQLRLPWQITRIDVDVAREEVHVFVDHEIGRLPCPTCGEPAWSKIMPMSGHGDIWT